MQQGNTVLSFWAGVLCMMSSTYGEDEVFLTGIRKHEGETLSLPIH